MPFGKSSQEPTPKQFMSKKHEGMGNHKTVLHSHGSVRGNASLAAAPTNQPSSGSGSPKTKKR